MDPLIVWTLVIGLVLILLFSLFGQSRSRSRGSTVLLFGETGSGKTTLFYALKDGLTRNTCTSIEPNEAVFRPQNASSQFPVLKFLDLPTSKRFLLKELAHQVHTVLFTVDSTSQDLSGASRLLYDIITLPAIAVRRVPIVIACTKTDLPGSQTLSTVESLLAAQMDLLRLNQSPLEALDPADRPAPILVRGTAFTFSDYAGPVSVVPVSVVPVSVVPVSAKNLSPLVEALQQNA